MDFGLVYRYSNQRIKNRVQELREIRSQAAHQELLLKHKHFQHKHPTESAVILNVTGYEEVQKEIGKMMKDTVLDICNTPEDVIGSVLD